NEGREDGSTEQCRQRTLLHPSNGRFKCVALRFHVDPVLNRQSHTTSPSEKTVDERSESRAFRKHQKHPKHQQKDDDWGKPPFLADTQEIPKFLQNREL